MKSISIKDIAKRAGVVPSTVSSVLNGKAKTARISDQLAEKIQALAKEMGYQPNYTAVSLRTGRTKILGLIIEDISNIFFATLAKTIEDEVYSLGYKIVYCSTENNDEKGSELVNMLLQRQVDGFLITPSQGMQPDVSKLLGLRKPVVLIDRYFPELTVPSTLVDNYAGVRSGIEHLLHRGYRNIAFVTVDLDQVQMKQREAAYRETLANNGMVGGEEMVLQIPYTDTPGEAVKRISRFIRSASTIDAVFFATNYLGIYGIESLKELGMQIPTDIAIISFDDHDIFRLYNPGVTVIEQPIEDIAKTAVRLLIQQLEGKEDDTPAPELVLKAPRLLIRGSTGG